MITYMDLENTTTSNTTGITDFSTAIGLNSLSAVRGLLGSLHRSSTSTVIQEYEVVEVTPRDVAHCSTLALKTLEHVLIEARYMFLHSGGVMTSRKKRWLKESQATYAFLQGTGLETMIECYQLEVDASDIRRRFDNTIEAWRQDDKRSDMSSHG